MNTSLSFYLFLFFHHCLLLSKIYAANSPRPYVPTDNILLNCGATSNKTFGDGRVWDTDSQPKYGLSPNLLKDTTAVSIGFEKEPSVEEVPYSNARIFHSKFTYTFPVSSAGQKFLRLYLYPANYSSNSISTYDTAKSFFSVDAATHSLLSNFSAFLNLPTDHNPHNHVKEHTIVKEFIITVNQSRLLEVTFTPSQNSYAFVNGIEVVSIPDKFYIKGNDDDTINLVGQSSGFHIVDSMALEKLYRLNVGGDEIPPIDDSGMFRTWEKDYPITGGLKPIYNVSIHYTKETPAYTAPEVVYSSALIMLKNVDYNLTWIFPAVDSGFYYLLRLYFCEYQPEVTLTNQRVFFIFINNQTADETADVIQWSGGNGNPVYKDYVVFVQDYPDGSKGKRDLLLALHPNKNKSIYSNAILNGLEIFKLSQRGGSLAAPNPEVPSPPLPTEKSQGNQKSGKSNYRLIGAYIGGAAGMITLFLIIGGFVLHRQRRQKSLEAKSMWDPQRYGKSGSTNTNNSSLPSVRSQKFSLEEIKSATNNFDSKFVIGIGGFGKVYRGYIENGNFSVAIKRLNPSSRQGAHEFQTEIKMLSNLRHLHLVSLIGYCDDSGEMILVYDYMVHGTLRSHLYRGDNPPLSWKQRLQICIGAARGLHYLHAGAERMIIHRDVKSTNILLDEKMVAKVSDFGLSKLGPSDTSVEHVSTIVKGSLGYLDPEYYRRQQLTSKSDVYSFGVVLFEVLSARAVVMPELPREKVNLAEWARNCYRKGRLDELVDKNIMDEIAAESLNQFGEVAYSCLRDQGIERPTMGDIVWSLEFALQLQESNEKMDQKMLTNTDKQSVYLLSGDEYKNDDDLFSNETVDIANTSTSETTTRSNASHGFKSGSVFSEIINPNAR